MGRSVTDLENHACVALALHPKQFQQLQGARASGLSHGLYEANQS